MYQLNCVISSNSVSEPDSPSPIESGTKTNSGHEEELAIVFSSTQI